MPAILASFSRAPGRSVALLKSNSTSDRFTISPRAVSRVSENHIELLAEFCAQLNFVTLGGQHRLASGLGLRFGGRTRRFSGLPLAFRIEPCPLRVGPGAIRRDLRRLPAQALTLCR